MPDLPAVGFHIREPEDWLVLFPMKVPRAVGCFAGRNRAPAHRVVFFVVNATVCSPTYGILPKVGIVNNLPAVLPFHGCLL